jgi:predicted transcriptional regulator
MTLPNKALTAREIVALARGLYKESGLTQKEIAVRIDRTERQIRRAITGKTEGVETAILIVELLTRKKVEHRFILT